MSNDDLKNNKNKYKENIFTKETVCVAMCTFCSVILIILFTRSFVFGDIGKSVSAFVLGVLGFSAFPVLFFGVYKSIAVIINKKSKFGLRSSVIISAVLFFLALIVHSATVSSLEMTSYGDYISYCFKAAEESAYSATGFGVIGAIITYPVIKYTTATGAFAIFGIGMAVCGYAAYVSLSKGNVPSEKKLKYKKNAQRTIKVNGSRPYPVNVDFDSIRRANGMYEEDDSDYVASDGSYYPYSSYRNDELARYDNYEKNPYGGFRKEPPVEGGRISELDRETRKGILFDDDPVNYRNANLIFDRDSKFNNRPSVSRPKPVYRNETPPAYKDVDSSSKGSKRVFKDGSYILREDEPSSYLNDYQKEKDEGVSGFHPVKVYGTNADKKSDDRILNRDYGEPDSLENETRKPFSSFGEPDSKRDLPGDYSRFSPDYEDEKKTENERGELFDGSLSNNVNYSEIEPKSDRLSRARRATSNSDSPFSSVKSSGQISRGQPRGNDDEDKSSSRNRRSSDLSFDKDEKIDIAPRFDVEKDNLNDDYKQELDVNSEINENRRFGKLSGRRDSVKSDAMRNALLNSEADGKDGSGYFSASLDFSSDKRNVDRRNLSYERIEPTKNRKDEENTASFLDFSDDENDDKLIPDNSLESPFEAEKEKIAPIVNDRFSRTDKFDKKDEKPKEDVNSARGMGVFGKTDFTAHKEYARPPLVLFKEYSSKIEGNIEEVNNNKRIIIEALAAFRIQADVESVITGPTFTRYDVRVPLNVSSKKVSACATEIAMAIHSKDGVNIFPNLENGTHAIEVPNRQRAIVGLGDILNTNEFKNAKSDVLMFAIGKDVEGRNIYGRIAKMTHLLVAGATGAGKSCFLNSLILSLIVRYTPQELRMILIDPKKIEFAIYNNLPHLMLNEIITEATKVVATLNWAIEEMERRYMLFNQMMAAGKLVRNIDEYNESVKTDNDKLPKIVIIVDELADLMAVAKKDIEDRISRLAAKSRACGIHLIIATQRPSVDVITGVIKSNLPTRFAFKVAAEVDSRTILDEQGAEKLLGNGDLLYKTASMYTPARVQGAFVSSEEVQSIVEYIKLNNEAYYDPAVADIINRKVSEESGEGVTDDASQAESIEPVYVDALRYVVQLGSASISMIQRKFSVGYNKAGRIVEWMEQMGYISQFDGSKSRKVLMSKEDFEEKYGSEGN